MKSKSLSRRQQTNAPKNYESSRNMQYPTFLHWDITCSGILMFRNFMEHPVHAKISSPYNSISAVHFTNYRYSKVMEH